MTLPPRTSSEWLVFLAELAERHRLETLTSAGNELQSALIAFLVDGGRSGVDLEDLQADLITILPRFHNALVQARHAGGACVGCSSRQAIMLFDEITRDMRALRDRQHAGGLQ